jgi:hypothetical protein
MGEDRSFGAKTMNVPRAIVPSIASFFLTMLFTIGSPGAGPRLRLPDLISEQTPSIRASSPQSGDPYSRLDRLYEDRRYFELRDSLSAMEGDRSPEMEFFRGALDNAFNRLDSAIVRLRRYLEGETVATPRARAKDAWMLLANAYARTGQYRKSAEIHRKILKYHSEGIDADEKTNHETQASLWSALADVPPQTVEVRGESVIPMMNHHVPIHIKDRTYEVAYDTGASLSVLYRSAAEELGLGLYGSGFKTGSATGQWIDSRVTVVPEIRLGEAVIMNAVFLVIPDDYFPVHRVYPDVERRGLIGGPILTALREIIETREGKLLIPSKPVSRSAENMCFNGFKPVVEAFYGQARLMLCLDTGSAVTFLYPPFFKRFKNGIEARSRLREITMGGVGSSRKVAVHVLDELAFRVGSRNISLSKIMVHTQETHSDSRHFDGVIGLDVLKTCARMIFNFESMSFILE